MEPASPALHRVTIALRLADDTVLPVDMAADSARFIGRYSRLAAFGPLGTRLRAHVVAQR